MLSHSLHSISQVHSFLSTRTLVEKSWIHVKSRNLCKVCVTGTFFFVLRIETDFNFLCTGLQFELGIGNSSTLEWPPKPSYASLGLAAIEDPGFVWWGFLNMLNLLLPEDNCRLILWEPFRAVRPKLQDLTFRCGDAGLDFCCAFDFGDSRVPTCKEDTMNIFHVMWNQGVILHPIKFES